MPKNRQQAPLSLQSSTLKWKQYTSPAVVAIVFVCLIALADYQFSGKASLLSEGDPRRAQQLSSAKLDIVVFTDFQHPDSARGQAVLREYLLRFPKDISWAVKYYSLGHVNSTPAFLYAQCAAQQGKFFEYQDALLALQPQWNNSSDVENYLRAVASKLGLDLRRLRACVEDDNTKSVIFRETAEGAEHLVKTVPAYFVNGEMLVGSEALKSYLSSHLD